MDRAQAKSIVKALKLYSKKEKAAIRNQFNESPGYFGKTIDHEAPIVVCDCIAFIRNLGFYETGVFRIPGNLEIVEALKNEYDTRFASADLKKQSAYSVLNRYSPRPTVNDVASLLKVYFNELPEPLIPTEVATALFSIYQLNLTEADKNKYLSEVIKRIKCPNREVLGLLIAFLRELSTFRQHNQMTVENIATCFVFCLFGKVGPNFPMTSIGLAGGIIKKLLRSEVKIFMPMFEYVQQNTRYKDDFKQKKREQRTDDYGNQAGNLFGGMET